MSASNSLLSRFGWPRRVVCCMQDTKIITQLDGPTPPEKEHEHIHKRLPFDTWIQNMDKMMIDICTKLELFSDHEWHVALNKFARMKTSGLPYRCNEDANFKNALKEINKLFALRGNKHAFAEAMTEMVRTYAESKRRKAMEEIAFILTVIIIQPQLNINETW